MSVGVKRSVGVAVAGLLWLSGCEATSVKPPEFLNWNGEKQANTGDDTTGSVGGPKDGWRGIGDKGPPAQPLPPAMPSSPNDDLNLGKKQFRAANFGLAERHFRRAVELHPRDLEAWVGLAAAYDRLRRFDLADRAYDQAIKIAGPTPELLNNRGYSFMLRGDYRRAQQTLLQAQALDPSNPYVRNNLELLEASFRKGKAIQ